jgi:hypothetical protein
VQPGEKGGGVAHRAAAIPALHELPTTIQDYWLPQLFFYLFALIAKMHSPKPSINKEEEFQGE